jgi:hypothetical protein
MKLSKFSLITIAALLFTITSLGVADNLIAAKNCKEHTGWTNFQDDRVMFDLGWHDQRVDIDVEFSGEAPDHDIAIYALGRGRIEPSGLFKVAGSQSITSEESLSYTTQNYQSGFPHQYYLQVIAYDQLGSEKRPIQESFRLTACTG